MPAPKTPSVINPDELLSLIDDCHNLLFSVTFIKKSTNTERKFICRKGVKKGVKGVGKPNSDKYIVKAYDMKDGWRSFDCRSVMSARIMGVDYVVQC